LQGKKAVPVAGWNGMYLDIPDELINVIMGGKNQGEQITNTLSTITKLMRLSKQAKSTWMM